MAWTPWWKPHEERPSDAPVVTSPTQASQVDPTLPPTHWLSKQSPGKLTPDQQRQVCALLGQFRTVAEIQEQLLKDYRIEISTQSIYQYKTTPKWQPLVAEARAHYIATLNEIPIANKVVRLERYELLYQQAMKKQNGEGARRALVAAQQELEGVKGDTTVYVHQQIVNMDSQTLERRRKEIAGRLQQLGGTDGVSES